MGRRLKRKCRFYVQACYLWVHLTGELNPAPRIIVYEYQKTRHSDHPKECYKNFKGILVTDGLSQYHKIARELEHLENANCWAHARRDFSDAIKAIGTGSPKAIKESVAYKALVRISAIYKLNVYYYIRHLLTELPKLF